MIAKEMPKTDQPEILVVDDTLATLQLLTGILTDRGYRVRPASSGHLALRSVAYHGRIHVFNKITDNYTAPLYVHPRSNPAI